MSAAGTLAAWKDAARSSTGGDNLLRIDGVSYSFDAHPRALGNGALMGRTYRQRRGELSQDIGGFKIEPDGRVSAIPAELRDALPLAAPAPQPDRLAAAFSLDDVEAS
jgi:hypothetical protein